MVISVICRPSLDTDASSLSMSLCNRSSNVIVIDVLGTSPEGTVLLMTTLSGVKTSAVCSTSMDADPVRSPPTAKPPLTVKSSPACTSPVTYKKLFAPNPSLLMERLPLTMVTQFRGVFDVQQQVVFRGVLDRGLNLISTRPGGNLQRVDVCGVL